MAEPLHPDENVLFLPLNELSRLIRTRQLSPLELMRMTLERIGRLAEGLKCFITVRAEGALAEARHLEALLDDGEYLGPLHGVPISIKDNIATAGIRTTAGSRLLANWVPEEDAVASRHLREAGAVVVAKANLSEFAYGAPHPDHGLPGNPWDLSRSPGGSSSGSACALAAGLCFASVGTDTGGSIRIPSSFCGVVGLKPTYDLVSRKGVVPISYNLDHVGPMARTVTDAAIMLEAMRGRPGATVEDSSPIAGGVAGLRLGILSDEVIDSLETSVRLAVTRTYEALRLAGARLEVVELPDSELCRTAMWTIAGAEAADYHRKNLRSKASEFGPEVRTALERSEFIPATAYVRAQRVRQAIVAVMEAVFDRVDALVLPATPIPAHPVDQRQALRNARQRFTTLFNLTGQPALVVPVGLGEQRLPVSMQVAAPAFAEDLVFRIGRAVEDGTIYASPAARPVL